MSRVVVTVSVSLDGVMQAPGRAGEDVRGGFDRGGWAVPFGDPVMGRVMGAGMAATGALVLGRRTYEDFAGFWPAQVDNPFTEVLDGLPKFVASRTLAGPLPWRNSSVLPGDAVDAVAAMRREPGADLVVLGSGELVRSLRRRGLVDEYVLSIHPLVLGTGRRLFADGDAAAGLRLVDSVTTTTGVLIGRYRPA